MLGQTALPTRTDYGKQYCQHLFLTLIGTNGKLYTYMSSNKGEKWVEKFPPIGSTCLYSSCVSTGGKVLVFTGEHTAGIQGHKLDVHRLDWTHFVLNHQFSFFYRLMFRFVHNGVMYQAAGIDMAGANTCFLSCPVSEVENDGWTGLRDMPHYQQTLTCFKGHILGLGGRTDSGTHPSRIKAIYRYDIESDLWSEFGEMEVARCDCLVAVVSNKMIVVGGEDSEESTSRTDIATPI